MGGGSSVQKDNYVLRALPGDTGGISPTKIKPPLESQKSQRKRSIDGSNSPLPISPSSKGKSSKKIAVSPDEKTPSLNSTRSQSSRSMKGMNTGDLYPWLMKNTKLNNANLNNFEFGPVIGNEWNCDLIQRAIETNFLSYC